MTTPPGRVILFVPFAQKEQAKALGGRWDQENKHWWIPATMDPSPFVRWLPSAPQQQPLYEGLCALNPEEFDPYGERDSAEVVFVPWTCWKCNRTTLAFHGALDRALAVTHLFYQPRVIEELDKLRKQLKLIPFGCIKPRFSRTVGAAYVSQGCTHCDALIGENPLWEDFNEIFNTVDISAYPYCKVISWSDLRRAGQTQD